MVCYTAEVMADTDGIIIGSGMAGLTSGCLLAKKGLKVPMVERNQRAGGRGFKGKEKKKNRGAF